MTDATRAAVLAWHRADGTTVEFPLPARAVVGRDAGAGIRIDEPLVSRAHAEILRQGEAFLVRDLGSTNFTRVNGEIVGECELQDGDELRFGRARCTFLRAETPSATPPADDRGAPS
jgi:predicted component of type VI protein secretion system